MESNVEKCSCGRNLDDCMCEKPIYTEADFRNKLIGRMTLLATSLNYESTTVQDMRKRVCDLIMDLYKPVPEKMQHDMDQILELDERVRAERPEIEITIFPVWLAKMIAERTQKTAA